MRLFSLFGALLLVACDRAEDDNTGPSVSIDDPGVGPFYTDLPVALSASVADDEDALESLRVWWESDLDGALSAPVAPGSGGVVAAAFTLSEGEHTLTLYASDSDGAVRDAQIQVPVGPENRSPSCVIDAPEDGTRDSAGAEVTFSGALDDADEGPEGLAFQWSSDLDGVLSDGVTGADGGVGFSTSALSFGTHAITLSVVDEREASCEASILYTVGVPPEILWVSPEDGARFQEDETVPFYAEISDNDTALDAIVVRWESASDGLLSEASPDASGASVFDSSALSPGEHSITLTATDDRGLYDQASLTVVINGRPTAPEILLSPSPAQTEDPLIASVITEGVDPEGATISYTWRWTVDGSEWPSADDATEISADATAKGQVWAVSAIPSDGEIEGASGTAEVTIQNTPPVLAAVEITPEGADTGDLLRCAPGDASDVDGDALNYSYRWTLDGVDLGVTSESLPADAHTRGDAVVCYVTPDDGEDAGAEIASDVLTIENAAPSISGASITPDPAYEGDVLSCAASGALDLDGDAINYSYAWSVDGVLIAAMTSTLGDTWWGRDEVVVCEVTPDDGSDSGAPVASAGVTIQNTAPSATDVQITPSEPVTGDALTCSYTFEDADGDADLSAVEWWLDGALVGTGATFSDTQSGDALVCQVTPDDGDLTGATAQASVTVVNSAPELADVSLSPEPAFTADVMSCAPGDASDVDGDALNYSYRWTLDGATVSGLSDAEMPAAYTERGDRVQCHVTVDDGADSAAEVSSNSVVIDNTPPVTLGVSLTPLAPQVEDTIAASVSTDDSDGDSVSVAYLWFVDGVGQSETGASLSGAFSKGQDVYVIAVPDDGIEEGESAIADAVTIQNTPPDAPEIAIEPERFEPGDELWCAVDVDAEDVDGDAVSYDVLWTADGSLYPDDFADASGPQTTVHADDTVPVEDAALADSWTCTVTPSDGEDPGAPATATADVLFLVAVGNNIDLGESATAAVDYLLGSELTLSSDATLYRFGVLMNAGGASVKMGLYDDAGGAPGELVAQTDGAALRPGVNEIDAVEPVELEAGTYWLMAVYDAALYAYPRYDSSASTTVYYTSHAYGTALPTTFSGSSYCCEDFNYYVLVE